MNRRDFLHPRHLARTAGHVAAALEPDPPPPPPPPEVVLLRLARRAMATTFEIVVPFGTPRADETAAAAFDRLDALDRLAAWLRRARKMRSALLHGGRSSVYAMGTMPGDERGWPVDLAHPWEAGRNLARVWLRDRALGTSAATYQHLEHEGRKL